jgi:hypothetical protein
MSVPLASVAVIKRRTTAAALDVLHPPQNFPVITGFAQNLNLMENCFSHQNPIGYNVEADSERVPVVASKA